MAGQRSTNNPLGPIVGFFVLLIVGGGVYLASPAIITWLGNTSLTFGAFGWQILPLLMPPSWPPLMQRLVITGFGFMIVFIMVVIVLMLFMKPEQDEISVNLNDIRREKAARQKGRR